jgi:hypothetical protein
MNATLPSTRPVIITSILFSYSQVHDTNAGIASQPRTVEVDDGWHPPPQRIVPNAPDCSASTTQPSAALSVATISGLGRAAAAREPR